MVDQDKTEQTQILSAGELELVKSILRVIITDTGADVQVSEDVFKRTLADEYTQRAFTSALPSAIAELSPRQSTCIIKRFGLDGKGERSLEEIGEEFGVTRERIRQCIVRALHRIFISLYLPTVLQTRDLSLICSDVRKQCTKFKHEAMNEHDDEDAHYWEDRIRSLGDFSKKLHLARHLQRVLEENPF